MDIFILDKVVIAFGKRLMTDSVYQFGTLVGLWLLSELTLPSKNNKEQKK